MEDFQLTNPENPDKCDPSKSQWYLDPALAERIVSWALLPDAHRIDNRPKGVSYTVLEPSAGRGALANPLREYGCDVTCVDIDVDNILHLTRQGHDTYEANFLELKPADKFELAVMNPPFEGGQTEDHILHALKFAPRVVCHCPLTTLAGQDRRTGLWAIAYLKRLVIHASRPKYSGNQRGGMTDMCTIDVVHRPEWLSVMKNPDYVAASGVDVEWWA